MSEWKKIELGKLADIQTGPFGSQLHQEDYVPVGTPLITVKNLGENKVTYNKLDFVSDQDKERLSKFILQEGDIVFSRVGYVDRRAFITKNERGWLFSGSTLRVRVKETSTLNPKYLSYYFGQQSFKEEIKNMSVGATRPSLNTQLLEELEIIIPPLPEQRAIASVLSSLDDKIDLLHRQNKTLEAMAETLFRQWFVEEAEGGWEGKTLSSIAEHKKYNVKPDQNPATIYRHYSIPAFDDGKQPIKELGSEIKSNKYQVVPNSILISKLNPRFPRVWAITDLMDENSICSTEFQVVYPTQAIYYGFIYCLLKSKQVTGELIGAAGGTSGSHQRVKPEDIFNLSFQMPPNERIGEFNLITSDHLKKVSTNMKQIHTLEKLRDALLPKLMSGEVRVEMEASL